MSYNPKKHSLPPFGGSGVLLVDKPAGWTSHDVVQFIRMHFNVPKVGHCGTLDPAATGLLVVVLGRFTRLSQRFSGEDKTYQARILLGTVTDSQDMDGNILQRNDWTGVTEEKLRNTFQEFVGDIEQIPPMVSAIKKDGKRLYKLAREGVEVERDPKQITIFSIDVNACALPYADFTVKCSKGTYIRTLCSDVGAKLGCGAALFSLNRINSGEFELKDAFSMEEIKGWSQEDLGYHINDFLHKKLQQMNLFSPF